jgi:hypothetical protein
MIIVVLAIVPSSLAQTPTLPIHGLKFDGVDDYVVASANTAITENGTYTFSAWIYPTADESPGGKGRQVFQDSKSTSDRNGMVVNHGTVRFGYYNGSAYVAASGAVTINRWTHVVGLNNNGNVSIYINNVLQAGTTAPYIGAGASGFYLGKNTLVEKGNAPFEGIISEVRIYNRALSAIEIENLYKGYDVTNRLVGYWKLDEDSGTIAHDSTANNNNGMLYGNPVWFTGGG